VFLAGFFGLGTNGWVYVLWLCILVDRRFKSKSLLLKKKNVLQSEV